MSNCEKTRLRVQAALDGSLDDRESREYRDHVRACGSCAEVHADAAMLAAVSARSSGAHLSRDLWPELQQRIADSAHRRSSRRSLRPLALAAAATLLLALGVWAMDLASEDSAHLNPNQDEIESIPVDRAMVEYERAAAALQEALEARGESVGTDSLRKGLATTEALVGKLQAALNAKPRDVERQEDLRLAMKHRVRILRALEATTRSESQEGS